MRGLTNIALASLIAVMSTSTAAAQSAPPEEISGARHVTGAVVAVVPGFGLGHTIQGRWKERGWIFTLGELVTFGMAAVAASESDLDQTTITTLAIVGWGGYLGLRVWEVADAIRGPRRRTATVQPFVMPRRQRDDAGVFAGVVVRF